MQTLHFQTYGELNRPLGVVVLLHGLFGMSDNLSSIAKIIANDAYVVVPDLVNHGLSRHASIISYASMANDVFDVLSELGVDKVSVLGHSMGGKVAMQMALMHPERIKKLIVADIAPVAYEDRHSSIIHALELVANAQAHSRKTIEKILMEAGVDSALVPFFLKSSYKSESGVFEWRFGLQQIKSSYAELSKAPEMHRIYEGCVMFIKGESSDYILPEQATIIKQCFPHAQFKVMQGAGHWLHTEKPLAFNRLVMSFLSA